jgi:hypothetical protein
VGLIINSRLTRASKSGGGSNIRRMMESLIAWKEIALFTCCRCRVVLDASSAFAFTDRIVSKPLTKRVEKKSCFIASTVRPVKLSTARRLLIA